MQYVFFFFFGFAKGHLNYAFYALDGELSIFINYNFRQTTKIDRKFDILKKSGVLFYKYKTPNFKKCWFAVTRH